MKTVILLLCSIFAPLLLSAQLGDMPKHTDPGKCYAKCLMVDEYEAVQEIFAIHTGDLSAEVILDSIYLRVEEATGDMIYLGYEEDLSRDDKDQIATLEKIIFLTEENETDEFVEEMISYKKLVNQGGYTEWIEVVCGNKVSRKLVKKLQKKLVEKGFLDEDYSTNKLDATTKGALSQYQKSNNLPIGQLDIKTLESLEIRY